MPEPYHLRQPTPRPVTLHRLAVGVIEDTYLDLLHLPPGLARVKLQGVLCRLRDYLAEEQNRDIEEVQVEYESIVSHPLSFEATRWNLHDSE